MLQPRNIQNIARFAYDEDLTVRLTTDDGETLEGLVDTVGPHAIGLHSGHREPVGFPIDDIATITFI